MSSLRDRKPMAFQWFKFTPTGFVANLDDDIFCDVELQLFVWATSTLSPNNHGARSTNANGRSGVMF